MDVDLEDMTRILADINSLKKEVGGLKIGSLLVWKYGLGKIVSEIRKMCDFPVIFDAQKAGTDIPSIIEEQVKLASDTGVDAFIASALGAGPKTLESFIKSSLKHNLVPIVVLEMTHPMANAFLREDASKQVLTQSLEMGVENFVAPGNNPERIKMYRDLALGVRKTIKIFSPGIGPQGGGPDTAVEAGADFVIVGRSIYEAKDPRKEVLAMYSLLERAYERRKRYNIKTGGSYC